MTFLKPGQQILKALSVFNIPDFPLAIYRRNEHKSKGMHMHEFTELVVMTRGSGIHCAGETRHPISRGDVFVIKGNQIHGYRSDGTFSLINILFNISKLGIPIKDLESIPGYNVLFKLEPVWRARRGFGSRLRLSVKNLTEVESLIEVIESELNKKPPGYQFMVSSTLMRLIVYLSRCYSQSHVENYHALIRIADAIEHLETHYDQPVALPQLARVVHMSVRHFQRTFWKVTGTSPFNYLVRLRITHGAELLQQEKDLNITEIACRVGFQDSNYFARQFRKILGCSPRKYRFGKMK